MSDQNARTSAQPRRTAPVRGSSWLPIARSELQNKITNRLESKFVFSDEIADVLAAALYEPCNLLLWGPGGHGKSEMVLEALRAVGLTDDEIFVQSFGEGMSEDRLWGGPDMASLDTCLRYDTDRSFLSPRYRVAVFEELFDAPAQALLPLKDVLTRRVFMNGPERVALSARVVIACTNKDPREFTDGHDAVVALMERFLLQKEVRWPGYEQKHYQSLFAKLVPHANESDLRLHEQLAGLIAGLNEPKSFTMSPRMAIQSLGVVKNEAAMNSEGKVTEETYRSIRFVQGMQSYSADLDAKIRRLVPANKPVQLNPADADNQNASLRLTRPEIPKAIESRIAKRFIHQEEITSVLTHAFYQPCNVLLWGPGGHGKSEMVMAAAKAMGYRDDEVFLQSFGEGMSEDRLWGGPNIAKLDECLEYDTERSFLPHEIVVLEEILDASSQALLPLKDVLTRRVFNNGNTPVQMKSRVIIACTNKDPRQFAKDSDAIKALLERFPLQLEVRWPSYQQADYEALFARVFPDSKPDRRKLHRIYAHVIASMNDDQDEGFRVSPRIALGGLKLAANSVGRHGRRKMIVEDILTIRNVQGMESYQNDLDAIVREALLEGGIEVLLSDIDERAEAMRGKMDAINKAFEGARDLAEDERIAANDATIDRMLELMSGMDRLRRELLLLPVSDPKLAAWKAKSEQQVEELAAEIEAGS